MTLHSLVEKQLYSIVRRAQELARRSVNASQLRTEHVLAAVAHNHDLIKRLCEHMRAKDTTLTYGIRYASLAQNTNNIESAVHDDDPTALRGTLLVFLTFDCFMEEILF